MKAHFTQKQQSTNIYSFVAYAPPDPPKAEEEPAPEKKPVPEDKPVPAVDAAQEDVIAGLLESTDVIEVARRKAMEVAEGTE